MVKRYCVGDKNIFAIEAEVYNSEFIGNLYLYVSGKRFGVDDGAYDIRSAIWDVINNYSISDVKCKNLFDAPKEILFDAIDHRYSDQYDCDDASELQSIPALRNHKINQYFSGFFGEDFIENNLDNSFFRYGHYMFDDCTVLTMLKGDQIAFFIKNEETNDSEKVTINEKFFKNLWLELYNSLEKK